MSQPYIWFSGMDWWYHSHAHSDFQLATRLAASRPVLFVNTIGMRVPVPGRTPMMGAKVARKLRSLAKLVRRPAPDLPNLYVMTPFSLPFGGRARRWNAASVRGQVRAVARALGFRDAVCIVTLPTAWDVVAPMRHRRLLYSRADKHSSFTEGDTDAIAERERRLLTRADRVLYVNRRLMEEERPLTDGRAVFLDHGVDLDLFTRRADIPDDLEAIPGPRAGFLGAVREYTVDVALLERVARELPEVSLVLVGDVLCPIDDLLAQPNVHWLGRRPYEDMPRYGSGLDVALMPWVQNDWIAHCNPIKLKEYLALGLPVVSMPFGDDAHYRDVIRVASSADDFVAAVRDTVTRGGPATVEARRAAVTDSPWDRKASWLIELAEG